MHNPRREAECVERISNESNSESFWNIIGRFLTRTYLPALHGVAFFWNGVRSGNLNMLHTAVITELTAQVPANLNERRQVELETQVGFGGAT